MPAQTLPPFQRHNHQHCIDQAVSQAQALCRERGVRLTEIRQRVLELIWQSHKPRGAYDLMEELGKEGRNSAPPTVYRALDFLQEQGLVHRIASLNAFIGCAHAGEQHHSGFLICRDCGVTQELDIETLSQTVQSAAQQRQFEVQQVLVEVSGRCPNCAKGALSPQSHSQQKDA